MRYLLLALCLVLPGCASFSQPIAPSTVQTIINDATMTLNIADVAAGVYEAMPGNNPGIALALGLAGRQAHAALNALIAAQQCSPNPATPTVVCAPITPQSLLLIAFTNSVTGYFGSVLAVVPSLPSPAA